MCIGRLISGLGGEQIRWTENKAEYGRELGDLVGNILFAAGCVAYLGPFNMSYRAKLTAAWTTQCKDLGIPVADEFSLASTLADPVLVSKWTGFGLPTDQLSIENALFVEWGRRWPLMIDPQGQANRWIKAKEKARKLRVVKLTQSDFLHTLENCIRLGTPVLMENVEEVLDPSLEPLLCKQIFKKAGRPVLRLGDTDVDFDEDFKFFITTKLSNPHYPPEICVKVTIVNFTVTKSGLEAQLLSDVVGLERPDLEEQKMSLVLQISDGQNELNELETQTLQLLSNAGDDLLDDEELIDTLDNSKSTSSTVGAQVEEAEKTAKDIDVMREQYRNAAERGSVLYFVIANMTNVDGMYQYSLQYFKRLFAYNIENSPKNDDVSARVLSIINTTTVEIFHNICRGLFEKDKILFAFMLTVQVLRYSKEISESDWQFFCSPTTVLDESAIPEYSGGTWLEHTRWVQLTCLAKLDGWDGLDKSFSQNALAWQTWASCPTPHLTPFPDGWQDRLSVFCRLLLLKLVRPEKLTLAIPFFVTDRLGSELVQSRPFDLGTSFAESDPTTPIIFVLSPGADPTGYLMKLAKDEGMYEKMQVISLGQGQGPKAEGLIHTAAKDGERMKWVCLQNCHLAASWMPTLEKIIEEIPMAEDLAPEFRLFLTSMPSAQFPVAILQNGIKITNEPARGLKANIRGSYYDMDSQFLESCSKPEEFKKLLYALCFFHAVIQERRKFGALGWNIAYEWNNSDRSVSQTMLKNYIDEHDDVPWETLQYVIGQVNYGGRVTDAWDQRCVNSLFKCYYTPALLERADFTFAVTADGNYELPAPGLKRQYLQFAEQLPASESPDVFGLHNNAEMQYQISEAKSFLDKMITMQPRVGSAGTTGQSPEQLAIGIAQSIQDKLPTDDWSTPLTNQLAASCTFGPDSTGAINSLGLFLSMEMVLFDKLLTEMRSSVAQLSLVLQGLAVMTQKLDAMFQAFMVGKVPANWENLCYISLKPLGGWCTDLYARIKFMQQWLTKGPPAIFWLPGFFFPQGFMTAVLQTHARKNRIPIDTLDFETQVSKLQRNSPLVPLKLAFVDETTQLEAPADGVYIYGIFLQGAMWHESGVLADALPGEPCCQMPILWLSPVEQAVKKRDPYKASGPGKYRCPMYKTSTRAGTLSTTGHSTNFVVALDIPSKADEDKWICCSVAMLCMLDD